MTPNLKQCQQYVEQLFANAPLPQEPQSLYAPIAYTLALGGKRLRPTLLMAAHAMFGGDFDSVSEAALGIEVFHNFTLLHDDLMDRSPLRRGQPTVYRRWGENTAVLSGDTMYALAWQHFLSHPSPHLHEVLQCFCQTAIEVCEGQQYDMDFEQRTDVDISQYLMMIRKKTAVLLAAALKIGALYAGASSEDTEKIYTYGIHLGLAFQLQDDLLDGYGDTAVFGKKTGQDIRDNKKTYLPLCALQHCSAEQADQLRHLLTPTTDIDDDTKVQRVMAIYDAIALRPKVEQAIANQFALATAALDTINVEENAKQPLREVLTLLDGRKK